jgi:hypothetical protein
MRNLKNTAAAFVALVTLGTIGSFMERRSGPATLQAEPGVTIVAPLPLPVTGTVSVGNFPTSQNVNVTNSSVPVTVKRTLDHDGEFFDVTMTGTATPPPTPTLTVPAGVVLTDAAATFSVPENDPNSASLFISDGAKTLVYQIVNSTTFGAKIDLGSGIPGPLTVQLSCYNIAGNHCQGALMWSGYTP